MDNLQGFQPNPSAGATAEVVEEIQAVIGQGAVLLPVQWGSKIPSIKGWQNTTITQTSDPAYLASLEGGNLSVLMGQPSSGLCSIDADTDEGLAEFLDLNPSLANTLQTRGVRGGNIWVQVDGEYPKQTTITTSTGDGWGEWRSTGGQTVIWGMHPHGVMYSMVNPANPVEVTFEEINWPGRLNLPWVKTPYEKLVETDGELLSKSGKSDFRINESALAAKFIAENRLIFEPDEEQFYIYDASAGIYAPITENELRNLISKSIKELADTCGVPKLGLKRRPVFHKEIVELLEEKLSQSGRGVFTRESVRFHVQNGVMELTKAGGILWEFHPEFVSRTQIPISFDPQAGCPRFLNELLRPAVAEEDIELLQTYLGSVFLGRNTSQKILVLSGAAGSGKSTFVNLLEKVIGKANVAELRLEHLGSRFETYSYRTATLLAGKDVPSDFLKNKYAFVLKTLSGGDSLMCEQKGGGKFSIPGGFHIIITSNADLQVALDRDLDAWERRLAIIKFSAIKERTVIPDFENVLLETEGSGILNFILEGAMKFLEHGVQMTQNQRQRVRDLLRESDSVRVFVEERVEYSLGSALTTQSLVEEYERFCGQSSWSAKSRESVRREIGSHLITKYAAYYDNHIGDQRGYRNITFKLLK